MKIVGRTLLIACVFLSAACSAVTTEKNFSYSLSKVKTGSDKKTKKISVDKIVVNHASFVDQFVVDKINRSLEKIAKDFYADGLACFDENEHGPWSYEVKFDEYALSKNFVTIIFNKFSVCSGLPYMGKNAATFSVKTGQLVPIKELLEQLTPDLLTDGAKLDQGFLKLGEDAGEKFINDHADQFLPNLMPFCNWYIKQVGFKVWPKKNELVLHPVFQQPYSTCYKDYFKKIEPTE